MKRGHREKGMFAAVLVVVIVALLVQCGGFEQKEPAAPAPAQPQVAKAVPPAKAADLAGIHKSMEVACNACHGSTTAVDDNETLVNAKCVECHGTLADVGKKAKGHINPHKAHIGDVSCTVCHHGHTASRSYCLNCHSFDMPIPGAGAIAAKKEEKTKTDTVRDTTDIVVIGAGAAGFTAAITAHDAGAKVVILEKQPLTGGNSMLSAGGMNAAGTKMQAARGIKDSPEIMFKDTMTGGQNINNPELVKILAGKSAGALDWVTSIGADMSDVGRFGGASVNRIHRPTGGAAVGANLTSTLKKNAVLRKIDVRVNSKAVGILRGPDGSVTGVKVEGKHRGLYVIEAKAVIVAAGGFSANASMVEFYQPSYKGMTTSNQPGATGDGMKLGEAAGGQLIDMKEIQIHPTIAAGSRILITEAVRGNGAILVNKEGKRFVNELTTRDVVSAATLKQQGGSAYLILDEDIRKSLKQIEGYFHLDLVKEGATLKDLAAAIGMPAANLEATVAAYSKAYDAKSDVEFKRPDMPRPIRAAKFYAIEVRPGIHYTMGGLRIDGDTRVLAADGKPVTGLFAAGEATGGVHGANRLGGNSIAETIVFGRIAGASAVAYAMKK